jgi:LmbE family N-acetylglucosaminyl deacetylase
MPMTEALDPATLDAQRVIVVAPHPDDEALGCGGLLWHLARRGRLVHVLFVTDGGASHLHSPTWPRARLAATREAEAERSLHELGLGAAPRTFLRLPDADLPPHGTPGDAAALQGVTALVRAVEPDLVLLPWRRDPHRDHRDAWSLVTRALDRAGMAPATLEYAIWLDEIGASDDHPRPGEMERVGYAIEDALPAKRRAVAAHRSQCGALIHDDPTAFCLTEATIERLTGPVEFYWRPL